MSAFAELDDKQGNKADEAVTEPGAGPRSTEAGPGSRLRLHPLMLSGDALLYRPLGGREYPKRTQAGRRVPATREPLDNRGV